MADASGEQCFLFACSPYILRSLSVPSRRHCCGAAEFLLLSVANHVSAQAHCSPFVDASAHFSQQGGIDEGEEPQDAAKRELREETGVTSAELIGEVSVSSISICMHFTISPPSARNDE